MKQYYECHITMTGDPVVLRPLVEALGWIFSAIDGDPNLGAGIKCYATKQFSTRMPEDSIILIVSEAADALRHSKVDVLREKVELVVYDQRYPGQ